MHFFEVYVYLYKRRTEFELQSHCTPLYYAQFMSQQESTLTIHTTQLPPSSRMQTELNILPLNARRSSVEICKTSLTHSRSELPKANPREDCNSVVT